MELLIIGLSLTLASLLVGLTGFGFAIVAVSLMSLVWPVKQIVAFLFVYNVAINAVMLFELRRHVHLGRVWLQVAGFIPGAAIGLYALVRCPDTMLKLLIGVTLTGFALWSLRRRDMAPLCEHWGWHPAAGLVSGLLGGAVAMAGPPVIVLNALTHADRFAFKADLQAFFMFTNIYMLAAYGSLGLFSWPLFRWNLCFAPLVLAGLLLGTMICRRLSDRKFQRISYGLVLLMGGVLLFRSIRAIWG